MPDCVNCACRPCLFFLFSVFPSTITSDLSCCVCLFVVFFFVLFFFFVSFFFCFFFPPSSTFYPILTLSVNFLTWAVFSVRMDLWRRKYYFINIYRFYNVRPLELLRSLPYYLFFGFFCSLPCPSLLPWKLKGFTWFQSQFISYLYYANPF